MYKITTRDNLPSPKKIAFSWIGSIFAYYGIFTRFQGISKYHGRTIVSAQKFVFYIYKKIGHNSVSQWKSEDKIWLQMVKKFK